MDSSYPNLILQRLLYNVQAHQLAGRVSTGWRLGRTAMHSACVAMQAGFLCTTGTVKVQTLRK